MYQDPPDHRMRHRFIRDDRSDPEDQDARLDVDEKEMPRWVIVAVVLSVIALDIGGCLMVFN